MTDQLELRMLGLKLDECRVASLAKDNLILALLRMIKRIDEESYKSIFVSLKKNFADGVDDNQNQNFVDSITKILDSIDETAD